MERNPGAAPSKYVHVPVLSMTSYFITLGGFGLCNYLKLEYRDTLSSTYLNINEFIFEQTRVSHQPYSPSINKWQCFVRLGLKIFTPEPKIHFCGLPSPCIN
jgi:hypothetical protein